MFRRRCAILAEGLTFHETRWRAPITHRQAAVAPRRTGQSQARKAQRDTLRFFAINRSLQQQPARRRMMKPPKNLPVVANYDGLALIRPSSRTGARPNLGQIPTPRELSSTTWVVTKSRGLRLGGRERDARRPGWPAERLAAVVPRPGGARRRSKATWIWGILGIDSDV
jgi:hypothetical protein